MANFLRDYEAEMRKYTDAPDIFHRACAVTLLGSLLTTFRYRMRLAGGTSQRFPNLWTFLIGDSGNSRKSTAVDMATEVLDRSPPLREMRAPDDGSPEGFAKDFVAKENKQKGNAAALVVHSEMGMFLQNVRKDYATGFKAMMMGFYDSPALYRRKLSKEEFSVPRPRLSLLGALATEFLPTTLDSNDWTNGFMSRALIVYGRRERTMEQPKTPPVEVYRALASQLEKTAEAWRRTRKRMVKRDGLNWALNYDAAALKRVREVKHACKPSVDPNVNTLRARGDIHLMKLSAIEQCALDPESEVITAEAVSAGAELFLHWWNYAPKLMEGSYARSNADIEGDRLPRRILRLLMDAPEGLPETLLMEATIIDWERFSKAVTSLEMMGKVERVLSQDGVETMIRLRISPTR
jgi:hypothetical protein